MSESDEAIDIGSISTPKGPQKRMPLPRMHSTEQNTEMRKGRVNSHDAQTNSKGQKSRSPKTVESRHDGESTDEDSRDNSQDSVTYSQSSLNTSSSNSATLRALDTDSPQQSCAANYSYEKSQKEYKTIKSVTYNSRIKTQHDNTKKTLYKTESPSYFHCVALAVLLALMTSALYPMWKETEVSNQKSIKYDTTHLTSEIKQLRSFFPSQNESTWLDFLSGMNDAISGDGPSLFLLLAIEEQTANCLAKKLAKIAQQTLNGEGELILNAETLGNNIETVINHKEDIKRSKAVIILDLLSVDPEALRGLHWLCDSEHPAVKEAVYFMTMKSDHYDESTKSLNYAEQELTNTMLNFIHEDVLAPLVTRITAGMVIPVWPEKYVPCSHPRY